MKFAGVPQTNKMISAASGLSSPYYGDMLRTYCCLTSFFPIVDTCLRCEDRARQSCAMVPRWRFLAIFCVLYMAPSVKCRKLWPTPTTRVPCSNAAEMRNLSKFAGVPKLLDRSQPLVGSSSPYCGDLWRRYCCLTSFFRLSICGVVAKI